MIKHETVINFAAAGEGGGYRVRIYESHADFYRNRNFFAHKHSDFELSYIKQGNGIYKLGERAEICEFHSGDIFLFGTNQIHCITDVDPGIQTIICNIHFEPRLIWSPLASMLDEEYVAIFNGKREKLDPAVPLIKEKILAVFEESINKQQGFEIMIKGLLYEIIAVLVRDLGITGSVRDRRENFICVDRTMTYINENIGSSLTLAEIARAAGFSKNYFSALFTKLNGLSPWDYITIKRIEKSKQMLRETDLSVIEVAARCGYVNLSGFNRMFARIVGTTPTRYRKRR